MKLAVIINTIFKITSRFTSQNKYLIKKILNATNSTSLYSVSILKYLSSVDSAANTLSGAGYTKMTKPQYVT